MRRQVDREEDGVLDAVGPDPGDVVHVDRRGAGVREAGPVVDPERDELLASRGAQTAIEAGGLLHRQRADQRRLDRVQPDAVQLLEGRVAVGLEERPDDRREVDVQVGEEA